MNLMGYAEKDFKRILENKYGRNDITIEKCIVKPLTTEQKKGYLGDHFKIKIDYRIGGKFEEVFLFCKALLGKFEKAYCREISAYEKESFFFSFLCQEYEKYEIDVNFAPKCFFSNETYVILEDLHEKKFKILPRVSLFSFDQATAVIKSLAEFHAASIILEEIKTKETGKPYRLYDQFPDILLDKMLYKKQNGHSGKWLNSAKKVFTFIVDQDNTMSTQNKEKLLTLFNEGCDKLLGEGIQPYHKVRNVTVHCDLWCNNLMLNEEEQPTKCCLIDFQLMSYSNQFTDFLFFLLTNTTHEFRKKHFADMLQIYLNTFENSLLSKNVDINNILPKNQILNSLSETIVLAKIKSLMYTFFLRYSDISKLSLSMVMDETAFKLVTEDFLSNSGYKSFALAEVEETKQILFGEFFGNFCLDALDLHT